LWDDTGENLSTNFGTGWGKAWRVIRMDYLAAEGKVLIRVPRSAGAGKVFALRLGTRTAVAAS
jgi:hypothetical protein